jgi:hypothetical protein
MTMDDDQVDDQNPSALEVLAEPAPWAAELGDLRSNVEALRAENARQATEAAYWRGVATANTPAPLSTQEEDIPDAAFAAAIENGDSAELVRLNKRQTEITARRMVQQLRTDTIDPMIEQYNTVGLSTLGKHTQALTASRMPYYDIPEVKALTDDILSKLTPQQRASEEGVLYAYKQACGEHVEAVVEFKRKSLEREALQGLSDGGGRLSQRGRNLRETHVPQPEDLGGDDARRAADAKGGGDVLAVKLGYANWNDYMEKTGMTEGARA